MRVRRIQHGVQALSTDVRRAKVALNCLSSLAYCERRTFANFRVRPRSGRSILVCTFCKLTGEAPTNMRDFVRLHAAEFKQGEPAPSLKGLRTARKPSL